MRWAFDTLDGKDADDVLRIMMTTPARQVAARFAELRKDTRVSDITAQRLEKLYTLFGAAATPGVDMAVRA
ncbi:hypothetical protein ACFXPY_36270 [Streptomyces sp. NPDC059153]|uniref:hypothetical protein n=1 Tax=unclassified Streptomyces TaxID=2593676 RepID=UPI0036D13DAA